MANKTVVSVVVKPKPKPRDQRHLRITSDKLRALLHEAWKKGNDSYLDHAKPDGEAERYEYIDQVMIDRGYKQPL